MAGHHHSNEGVSRGARMLRTALGPAIARYLEDPAVVEVMLNPDGRLWVDRLREGLVATDDVLIPADLRLFIPSYRTAKGTQVAARTWRLVQSDDGLWRSERIS